MKNDKKKQNSNEYSIEIGPLITNIFYVVTRTSNDGTVIEGESICLEYDDPDSNLYPLTLFTSKKIHGQIDNKVRYFSTKEDVLKTIEGAQFTLDEEFAKNKINKLLKEIKKIKIDYGI